VTDPLMGAIAYYNINEASYDFANGDIIEGIDKAGEGLLNAILGGASLNMGSCFAAGTPILTPDGSKPVDEIRPGDQVLAIPEDDPDAQPVPRMVEEIFENYMPTLDLHVNGRAIRTTAEHPFWVRDRGWVAAQQLQVGDELRTHDGRWVSVDGTVGPRPPAPVYNMRIAHYHTYFVGHALWGFAVWSHNTGSHTNTHASGKTYSGKGPPPGWTSRRRRRQSCTKIRL
jgi:Pretoxin HINT domain